LFLRRSDTSAFGQPGLAGSRFRLSPLTEEVIGPNFRWPLKSVGVAPDRSFELCSCPDMARTKHSARVQEGLASPLSQVIAYDDSWPLF